MTTPVDKSAVDISPEAVELERSYHARNGRRDTANMLAALRAALTEAWTLLHETEDKCIALRNALTASEKRVKELEDSADAHARYMSEVLNSGDGSYRP